MEKNVGEVNPADLGTKYLGEAEFITHLATTMSWYVGGRTDATAQLLNNVGAQALGWERKQSGQQSGEKEHLATPTGTRPSIPCRVWW